MQMQYIPGVAQIEFFNDKCISCGICIDVCPHAVFDWLDDKRVEMVNKDRCMECGACSMNCPVNAVEVKAGVG